MNLLLNIVILSSIAFSHLTMSDGLSTDACRCVIKDSRGFVWVGTEMGLNRYDGRRVRSYYRDELGLESDYIFDLHEDSFGNVWIGTARGPVVYNYRTDGFFRPALEDGSFLNDIVSRFTESPSGEIWFGGEKKPGIYSCSDGKTLEFHNMDIGKECPKYMTFVDEGKLAVACRNSNLYLYDTRKDNFYIPGYSEDFFEDEEFTDALNVGGILYLTSRSKGLVSVNLRTRKISVLAGPETVRLPVRFCFDGSHHLLIGTRSGMLRYDLSDGSWDNMGNHFVLGVHAVGNEIWAATSTGGVDYYLPESEYFLKTPTDSPVSALHEYVAGNVFFATESGDMYEYRSGNVVKAGIASRLPSISDFCFDKDGRFLALTRDGIAITAPNGEILSFHSARDFDTDGSRIAFGRLHRMADGSILLHMRDNFFIYESKTGSFVPRNSDEGTLFGIGNAMVDDDNGRVWTSSYASGIYVWDPSDLSFFRHYSSENSNVPLMNTSILKDSSSRIWIVGRGPQLYLYSTQQDDFIRYGSDRVPSFPDADFQTALEGCNGEIWIGTRKGLVRFDAELESSITYFDPDGLQDNQYLCPSLRLANGNLIFATMKGLVEFNPEAIPLTKPRTEVVGFEIGGKETRLPDENINLVREIKLPISKNSFGFSVSTPGQLFCESIQYRLDGYDGNSNVLSSDGHIRYYNIPAGRYTLSISGHDDIRIVITPPFWSSPAGISLISLISLLLSAGVVYFIMHRRVEKEKAVAREREIKEKLGFLSGFIALEQFDINSGDAEFIRKLDRIVTKHISDESFSVKVLEEELGMSHTTLNRRMSSVMNTTPVDYIKTKRLAVALHLLKKKGVTPSEVCYRVGFNSPSYFAKCFKEAYGCLPSEVG